jgi:ribose-phosphate pyrophosphokinase
MLFCLNGNRKLGKAIADRLEWPLSAHEEREFESGEHKARPLVEVGGRDVYLLHHLEGETSQPGQATRSANDKLIRTLFFIGALKHAGARSVTAVTPYLPYARKDRRTKSRDPVSMRYVASLFEAMATDMLITLDIHNLAAFENAFRSCRAENLTAAEIIADAIIATLGNESVTIVSPDAGGQKRAEIFRAVLEKKTGKPVGNALLEKHRSGDVVTGSLFAGDVRGRTAIIIDDMISSGGTIMRAVKTCRNKGATRVFAAATHGLFSNGAHQLFERDGPDRTFVTDSVTIPATLNSERLQIISTAPLLADAIASLSNGEPFYDLVPYN